MVEDGSTDSVDVSASQCPTELLKTVTQGNSTRAYLQGE